MNIEHVACRMTGAITNTEAAVVLISLNLLLCVHGLHKLVQPRIYHFRTAVPRVLCRRIHVSLLMWAGIQAAVLARVQMMQVSMSHFAMAAALHH